jgi:RNA polymerase sigma-70 factor (ECF subfamily)
MHDLREGESESTAADLKRFRDVVEPELALLYRVARRIVADEAEDAVQDCLLKAFRNLVQLDRDEAAPAWLRSILVNCCRDRIRRRARRPSEIWIEDLDEFSLYRKLAREDPFPYSDSLHLDFLHRFERSDVREVLASLPDLYRQPLLLVYVEGLHAKEVAHMMETPLGTMLARLHRGRKLFERRLWEYAEANDMLKEPIS